MDKIREALEGVLDCDRQGTGRPSRHVIDMVVEALALLSDPVASDARELAYQVWQIVTQGDSTYWSANEPEAAALIARYAADREQKAWENAVDKCADAVHAWILRGQSGGEIGLMARLNSIKEATK